MMSANTITCSISPLASAPIGFFGIMFSRVSAKLTESEEAVTSAVWICDISKPMPGLISRPMPSATATAIIVVKM